MLSSDSEARSLQAAATYVDGAEENSLEASFAEPGVLLDFLDCARAQTLRRLRLHEAAYETSEKRRRCHERTRPL